MLVMIGDVSVEFSVTGSAELDEVFQDWCPFALESSYTERVLRQVVLAHIETREQAEALLRELANLRKKPRLAADLRVLIQKMATGNDD